MRAPRPHHCLALPPQATDVHRRRGAHSWLLAGQFHGDAIGQTLQLVNEPEPRRVVGVVRELKYNGITEPSQPFVAIFRSQ